LNFAGGRALAHPGARALRRTVMKHDRQLDHREGGPLQEAFDAQAAGVRLELEPPNAYGRDIGAFVRFVRAVVEPGLPGDTVAPGRYDDELLENVVRGWEELHPDEAGHLWKNYATDPFVAVGRGAVGILDDQAYRKWRDSDELKDDMEEFPPYSPRRIRISQLRVTYVGRTTAVVTYSAEEDYQNGKIRVTNAGVMALKIDDSTWKIAAETIPEKSIR
jgi:hypothetical protein